MLVINYKIVYKLVPSKTFWMKNFVLSFLMIIQFSSLYSQAPIIAINQIGYLNNSTKNAVAT